VTRVLAIDWSGRRTGAEKHIWIAEATAGELVRLEPGRTREQVQDHLVALARDEELVVGLDFSFSLPEWFLDARGHRTAPELWDAAASAGEDWLRACEPPFWGRRGRPRPELPAHFRRTEAGLAAVGGVRPKSTFQIGGAGSVGSGSVRGFPVLAALQRAGFSVWPFDPPRLPLVVEIYPRLMTGPVVKSDPEARRAHLDAVAGISPPWRDLAAASEDAYDAAVSAVAMSLHLDDLLALPLVEDPVSCREGCVWQPPRAGITRW